MSKLVPGLAALSLGGGAAIALLAMWEHLSRTRYAARWRCWVWLVLCLRLLVVVVPQGPAPARPIQLTVPPDTVLYAPPQGQDAPPRPADRPAPDAPRPPAAEKPAPAPAKPAAPAPRTGLTLLEGLGLVWLAGALAVAGWALVCHHRFLRYLRRWSRPVTDPAILADYRAVKSAMAVGRGPQLRAVTGLAAPMLAGVFRPKLLLPADTAPGDGLRYALYHELSHFQRRDILLKTLALGVQCLHWFNPMVWYMNRLIGRDIELACDERALRYLPPEAHKAYGKTILDAVARLQARA